MRALFTVLLLSGMAFGQSSDTTKPADSVSQPGAPAQASPPVQANQDATSNEAPPGEAANPASAPQVFPTPAKGRGGDSGPNTPWVIPAGSKVPLSLAQAISTKNAREGDAVYAQTVFPFVLNERILIPSGTYIQGKISHTEKAGRAGAKHAEILIHFTTLIYPSGYTVMLPASIENTPGQTDKGVKDKEGTIQQDKDTGQRLEDAAKGAAVGGTIGGIGGAAAGGLNGARYGGLAGIAAGVAWALLKHGPDVKLDVGTSIEMEIQRDITIDGSRIQVAKAGS